MFNLFSRHDFADAHEAINLVGQGQAVLFDVRSPGEFISGHAAGAQSLPLEDIANRRIPQLPPDTHIYVYCRTGSRSNHAQALLKRLGYANVENIGDLHHWLSAGGAVTG